MNSRITMALVAGLALGGMSFAAQSASAMPMQGLDTGIATASGVQGVQQNIQNARYVCGYWGCRWVYGYYHPYWHRYGYGWHRYGWHRYGYRYGWHRGWHHYGWHRHGWHHWHR